MATSEQEPTLDELVTLGITAGMDLGAATPDIEGAYRRGYCQAIAEVVDMLRSEAGNAETLLAWLEGEGNRWRHDVRLDRKIAPPLL